MLKKQTVWLLTMLSLMIVLSVYYMMIDGDDQQAYIETDSSDNATMTGVTNDENGNEGKQNNDGQGVTNDDRNDEEQDEGTTNEQGNIENDDEQDSDPEEDAPDVSDFTNLGKEELFTMNRMEIQNKRSKQIDYLEEIVASADATTEEINKALDDIYEIDETETKENILQNTIMAEAESYQDVLVRSEEDMVYVHVMTDELSKEAAIDIMQLVRDEFGEVTVDVKYN